MALDLKKLYSCSRQDLLDDPNILKVSKGRAQTRAMSMRKDYAWNIKTVDEAVSALKKFNARKDDNK